MAKVQSCDGCGTEQAILLVQNLETGEPLLFGPRCALDWCEGMTAALASALGVTTPDSDGQAGSGELSAGGDTPGAAVAGSDAAGTAPLPAGDNPDNGTAGGGTDDERVRASDPGAAGVHQVGAGAPGADDPGGHRPGGPGGSGAGTGGSGADDAGSAGSAGNAGDTGSNAGDTGDASIGGGMDTARVAAAGPGPAGSVTAGP